MTNTEIKNKIINLETKLNLLKKTLSKKPILEIDEINWKKIKPYSKQVRKKLYKQIYG